MAGAAVAPAASHGSADAGIRGSGQLQQLPQDVATLVAGVFSGRALDSSEAMAGYLLQQYVQELRCA